MSYTSSNIAACVVLVNVLLIETILASKSCNLMKNLECKICCDYICLFLKHKLNVRFYCFLQLVHLQNPNSVLYAPEIKCIHCEKANCKYFHIALPICKLIVTPGKKLNLNICLSFMKCCEMVAFDLWHLCFSTYLFRCYHAW